MKFVATIMLFIGYVLVYAGVANGGKFATQPWMGILDDAYSQGASQSGSSGSGGTGSSTQSGTATQTQKQPTVSSGRKRTSSGSDLLNTVEGVGTELSPIGPANSLFKLLGLPSLP